jgi:hypothetical protein
MTLEERIEVLDIKIDEIALKVNRIETILETEEKNQLRTVNIRMWLIGLLIGVVSFVINHYF